MRTELWCAVLLVGFLCLATGAAAQSYPVRTIRLIAHSSPGGTSDILGRLMAHKLTEALGQQVVVENRAGASGIIGVEVAAKAAPDGYTMLITQTSIAINPSMFAKLPYNAMRDFAPITQLVAAPNLLMVHPSVPATSVKGFIALARAQPGSLVNGSPGQGTSPHLSAELFKIMSGIKLDHVQFKGAGMAIISLLSPDGPTRSIGVRIVHIERIEPNPEQPRLVFEQEALDELAASIREHGVLQPILVRPLGPNTYQIVAGERRWRASRQAGLGTIPALIEDIDDDTALEIAIIENLQREDLTPLDEAAMFDRMIHQHGYSIRKLADKLGKDKGYLENRLRLADAPPEIRELVSLRKDSLSHAYELMKVEDPKKRRRLAEQVARGELTLIKLRDKIEGRRGPVGHPADGAIEAPEEEAPKPARSGGGDREESWAAAEVTPERPVSDDALVNAKHSLTEAVDELIGVLGNPEVRGAIGATDRANLAKYLTIAKLRLENAIALVRSDDAGY